jgi:hypothetical protein
MKESFKKGFGECLGSMAALAVVIAVAEAIIRKKTDSEIKKTEPEEE